MGELFEKRGAPLPDLSAGRVFPHSYQVIAEVHPRFQWRLIDEYGPESFTVREDGMLLFSFGFVDKASIVSWIASFGGGAKLLEPAEFRGDVLAFAEEIRKNHLEP